MLKEENPKSRMRHKMLDKCSEKDVSYRTIAKLTKCMTGKTEEEKEALAEQLLVIISESKNEEEMIRKAKQLRKFKYGFLFVNKKRRGRKGREYR